MARILKGIRTLALAIILTAAFTVGDTQEASAFNCQFCVATCPSDVEQFCLDRGCDWNGAQCMYYPETPGTCGYYYTGLSQVNCNLI